MSTQKWKYRPKRKDYGYESMKVKRMICSAGKNKTGNPPNIANAGDQCIDSNVCIQQGETKILYTSKEGAGSSRWISGDISSRESTLGREIME